jgi:hypothetical protein
MPTSTWSCAELTALLVNNVLDPQKKGGAGGYLYCNPWGGACPPSFWRDTFTSTVQLNAGVTLLMLSYTNPELFGGGACEAVQALPTAAGRVKLLAPIRAWGAAGGFTVFNPASYVVTYTVQSLLLKIFADPTGSRVGSTMTEVIVAAAEVVRTCTTPVFDAAAWLPLWGWAAGGPDGGASIRTRSFAMKALAQILRRGTLRAAQIRAADTLATVLNNTVAAGTAGASAAERALYRADATALLAEVQAALDKLEAAAVAPAPGAAMPGSGVLVPPPVPPQPRLPPWAMIAASIGVAGLLLGGAVLIKRRHAAA